MRISKSVLNVFILLLVVLIVSIIWRGGFEVELFGKEIRCHTLINPLIVLSVFLFLRFCLEIGGKNSLTLIGALFFSAALAEMILRMVNTPMTLPVLKDLTQSSNILGYRLAPSLKDRSIQTNSHGLRDRERRWEKPEGMKRLLGIGDSFTFGYEVSLEDCYLKQLERRLNRETRQWDVINAGVSGYNMWQYLAYFEHYGYRYEPDMVTVGVFFDDFYGDPSQNNKRSQKPRYHSFSSVRLINFGRNCLELLMSQYRYLLGASWLRSIEERREYILNSHDYLLLSGKASPELYEKFEMRLKSLVQKVKEQDARILVLLIPDVIQLNHPELQVLNNKLFHICQKCRVDFLDMTPYFEKTDDIKNLYLLPHDAHISPKGHQIIARELEKKIRSYSFS